MAKITVLFQGDSITDCGRANCGGAGFSNFGLGPGYAGMIAARLMCDRPDIDWEFINRGISGNRIVDLYARWKADCINLNPDVVSILIGVNDTWHRFASDNGVGVPRYTFFYHELLHWTHEKMPKTRFVLLDPFVCSHVGDRKEFVEELTGRRLAISKLAEEFDAIHIPLQSVFDAAFKRAPEEYWAADGVHPTPAGHQLITDAWLEATRSLFPTPAYI